MICKCCRLDLPECSFNPKSHTEARVRGCLVDCLDCSRLTRAQRKQKTRFAIASIQGVDSQKAWHRLNTCHKRQILMDKRTKHEMKLTDALNKAKLEFESQFPVGPYFLDLCFPTRKLALEVDGSIHDKPEQKEYDDRRTSYLEERDWTVLRFKNAMIDENINGVLWEIRRVLDWETTTKEEKDRPALPKMNIQKIVIVSPRK